MTGNILHSSNQYRILRCVSEDKEQASFLVEKDGLGTRYLLKRSSQDLTNQAEFQRRMRAELKLMAGEGHAGLPRLHDRFRDDHYIYNVYDFVSGVNLEDMLETPLSPSRASNFVERLLSILSGIHKQNWFHGGLHPDQLKVRQDGQLTLLSVSQARPIIGDTGEKTPIIHSYTAPEQIKGEVQDQRTDVYALGALLYRFLTARDPFRDSSERSMHNAILQGPPPRLGSSLSRLDRDHFQGIINNAMATSIHNRFKNTDLFTKALQTRDSSLDDSLWGTPSRSFDTAASLGLPESPLQDMVTELDATVALDLDDKATLVDDARTLKIDLDPQVTESKNKPKPRRNLWEG